MGLWNSICGWFGSFDTGLDASSTMDSCSLNDHCCDINPANGLPMIGGCGGVDVEGNPYGTDTHHEDFSASSISSMDDSWLSVSAFDDSWGCGMDTSSDWESSFDSSSSGIGSDWND